MKKIWGLLLILCLCMLPVMQGSAASISSKSVTMQNGKTKQLKLKGVTTGKVTWRSSNTATASVSSKGLITANHTGTCVISATYKNKTYKCTVKVTQNENTKKFLTILKRYFKTINSDIKNDKYWTYGKPDTATFTQSRNKNRRLTCTYPTVWALREMKLFGNGDMLYAGSTTIKYKGSGKSKASKLFRYIKTNKKLSQLVAQKQLQVGDIVFMKDHMNVYAGQGYFYDTGRTASDGYYDEGDYYFDSVGAVPIVKNFTAYYILRFK